MFFGYILLTNGRKPLEDCLIGHLPAKTQMSNLVHAREQLELSDLRYVFDFARSVSSLSSLPRLEGLLTKVQGTASIVLIDDFRRLFGVCPMNKRMDLFEELSAFDDNFKDLRTGESLAKLNRDKRLLILAAEKPIHFNLQPRQQKMRSKADKTEQTSNANEASAIARREQANTKAFEVANLKHQLEEKQEHVTLKVIAETANAEGLRTTRGKQWTAGSVQRALKRVESILVAKP